MVSGYSVWRQSVRSWRSTSAASTSMPVHTQMTVKKVTSFGNCRLNKLAGVPCITFRVTVLSGRKREGEKEFERLEGPPPLQSRLFLI